jgi:hypothetical protein
MSGYWETGIARSARMPATTMTMDTTAASRGRSTKTLEIMSAPVAVGGLGAGGGALAGA